MLDQSARVAGTRPEEVLLDAGYFDDVVIAATLERDISLLCPEGQTPGEIKASKVFHKSCFQYDESTDSYRCPAEKILFFVKSCDATPTTRAHRLYRTAACSECPLKKQCTKMARRSIKRHPEDTQRDALRQVMQQPGVRSTFRKRQAMVEPVFSHLRAQQGLTRFRRKGLRAVRLEFALHVMAYNLSRAVALKRALFTHFFPFVRPFLTPPAILGRVFSVLSFHFRYRTNIATP
jgi:hypothetical protein